MTRAWSEFFVELPALWDLCLRLSLVLFVAWGLHAALARSNPRWRVQLWRFTSVALVFVGFATLLPRIVILVEQQAASVNTEQPATSVITMSEPILAGTGNGHEIAQQHFLDDAAEFPLESFLPEEEMTAAISDETTHTTATSSWGMWLLASMWATGAGLLALRWTRAQLRIRELLSRSTSAPKRSARILRGVADRLNIFGDFELRLSTETDVPFVAGLLRPIVVLPARMAERRYAHELPAIFAHELTHVKSRDLVWMGVSQWITIPLWFHPLTWKITTAHSMACEEVADAVAADNVGDVARYTGTLARVALAAVSHPPTAAAISMARSSQIMSRLARLKRGLSNTPLARRWLILSAVAGLLVVVPLATIKLAYADEEATDATTIDAAGPGRALHFPTKQSVGILHIATEKETTAWDEYSKRFDYRLDWDWKYFGQAQGDVTVPAGAKVKLEIKKPGAVNTSWITQLQPDDLYEIVIYPHPSNHDPFHFGDAQLRHIGHLTGLQELTIQWVQVSGKGLGALKPLTKLEKLMFHSPESGNDCLQSIGELTSLQVLSIGQAKWDDAGLAHLDKLTNLEEIFLPFAGVPGRGFDTVVQLPKLKLIDGAMFFKNVHLARLKKSKSLEALHLGNNALIDDSSMKFVAQLPQLEYLDLFNTNITDAGVEHLPPLKSLKRLNLQVNRQRKAPSISVKSGRALSQLSKLERLNLNGVGDANRYLEHLARLKHLKSLTISGRRDTGLITDDGFKHLSGMSNLEYLNIGGTVFSDLGADHLSQLKGLKTLYLQSDSNSENAVAKLNSLKQLTNLSLVSTHKSKGLPQSSISQLRGLTNLTGLTFYGKKLAVDEQAIDFSGLPALANIMVTALRDQDVASLSKCKNLRSLQAGFHPELTDDGLALIADLTSMEVLWIGGNGVTDAGLEHLSRMSRLHSLTTEGRFTEKGLRSIERFKSLGRLRINTTEQISPQSVARLENCLPGLYSISVGLDRTNDERAQRNTLKFGQEAPPFEVTLIDGEKVSLKDYRGKVLLLYFWSTNCQPCVASVPSLKTAYAEMSKYKDFAMIGLSGDDSEPIWKEFIRKQKLPWPQARIGDNSKIAAAYGVAGYPRYILVGRDGKILTSVAAEVDSALRKALEVDGE